MTRQEKADRIHKLLDALYPETPVPLDHTDPYTLLIAVLLSAQSTDKKVNEITPALFRRADNPKAMAALQISEITSLIRQIGLAPTKAKNIHRLSEMLVENTQAKYPLTSMHLRRYPALDIRPLLLWSPRPSVFQLFLWTLISIVWRRGGVCRTARMWRQRSVTLKKLFPRESWNRVHLQIIFFGRILPSASSRFSRRVRFAGGRRPRNESPKRARRS